MSFGTLVRKFKQAALNEQLKQAAEKYQQEMTPVSATSTSGYPITGGVYDEINTDEMYDELNEDKIGYTMPNVDNSKPLPRVSYQPLGGAAEVSKDENANQSTSEPEHVDVSVIDEDKNADPEYLQVLSEEQWRSQGKARWREARERRVK